MDYEILTSRELNPTDPSFYGATVDTYLITNPELNTKLLHRLAEYYPNQLAQYDKVFSRFSEEVEDELEADAIEIRWSTDHKAFIFDAFNF